MKKNLLLLLLILNLASGCKQITIWKYGIRSPKTETPESILDYALKNGQNPENIFLFRDSSGFFSFFRDSLYKTSYFSAIVFDKNERLINFKDTSKCQWTTANEVGKLKKDTIYPSFLTHRLDSVISLLKPLGIDTAGSAEDYDFTVIFTWAKYIGQLNNRLFSIQDASAKNKNARIRVISLNLDMQKSWGLTKEQKVRLHL